VASRDIRCLFVWTRTGSMMGEAHWPFYGSMAVAAHAMAAGADVTIFDRRRVQDDQALKDAIADHDLVFLGVVTADIADATTVLGFAAETGRPAIVGGVHPTAVGHLADGLERASAGIFGDGMSVIATVLDDFRRGKLQRTYEGTRSSPTMVGLLDKVTPDRASLPSGKYGHVLITEMGCPNKCTFCFDANSGTHRRDPQVVAEEIRRMGPGAKFGLFDDNVIGADPEGAIRFAEAVREQGTQPAFFGNTDATCIMHPEALQALRAAGMASIYVGFESIFPESVKLLGKMNLIRQLARHYRILSGERAIESADIIEIYSRLVDDLHRYGFTVYGGIITGWPHETPACIEALAQFAQTVPDLPWLSLATPYPGTGFARHLENRGIVRAEYDSPVWDTNRLAYQHPRASAASWYDGVYAYYQALASDEVIEAKRQRLSGASLANWAVDSIAKDLKQFGARSHRVYREMDPPVPKWHDARKRLGSIPIVHDRTA
jgi:radical SAM superfamily enzyme YgiQ (UPF0313 family)